MRRKKTTLLLLTLFVLLMAGCGAESDASFAGEAAPREQDLEAGDFDEEFVTNSSASSPDRGALFDSAGFLTEPTNDAAQQRLIIRVGDLNLVVEDTESALTRISKFAEDGGGWVVSSGAYQYSGDAKTGEIIPVVMQKLWLLRFEKSRLHQVFYPGIEHELVGLDTVVAIRVKEIDHPVTAAECSAADVQQLVPGIEAMPDQRFELGAAGFLESPYSTADLGGNFIQPLTALLQRIGRIDWIHAQWTRG